MDKITIERETLNAAMMALEYLLEASPVMTTKHRDAYSTAARLRAALAAQPAEAQQEPVAWAVYKGDECLRVHEKREWAEDWARAEAHFGSVGPYHIRELFAAPPAQPDHQGHSCTHKCTWPQCQAAQPAPAQEPQPVSNTDELPQRLSDERIMHFWDIHAGMPTEKYPLNYKDVRAFARAIEAAIVPPGYALVPIEPTHGMLSALTQEWHPSKHGPMKQRYRAMIAAAQKASHDPR